MMTMTTIKNIIYIIYMVLIAVFLILQAIALNSQIKGYQQKKHYLITYEYSNPYVIGNGDFYLEMSYINIDNLKYTIKTEVLKKLTDEMKKTDINIIITNIIKLD